MNMKITNYIIVLLLLLPFSLISQEDKIKFDEVKVIKEFNANLADFNKINIDPVLPVFDIKNRTYTYSVRSVPVKLNYEKPMIRPLALKPVPNPISNKYKFKIGYGAPKYLKSELSIGYKKHNQNANLLIRHISADNSKNLKDQKISNNLLGVSFYNRNNSNDLETKLNINLAGDYYYLYATEANKDSNAVGINNKRRFLRGDINASFGKEELFYNIDNKFAFNYKFLQVNTSGNIESNIVLSNSTRYNVNDNLHFELPLKGDIVLNKDLFVYSASPEFIFNSRPVNLKLRGDFALSQDSFYIFPGAELSINIFHNFFELLLSISNDIYNNSNYSITNINPFLNIDLVKNKSSIYNNFSASMRSSMEGAKIEASVTYQKFKNKLLFINSSIDKRTFETIYESGTNLKIDAIATYRVLPEFEISGTLTKNFYTMDNIDKAWFTPDFTANINSKFLLLNNKLQLNGELFFGSQSWYLGYDNKQYKLDPLFDISTEIKYRLFPHSFIFGELNNILAQKYQRWYQYPSLGLNFLAGIEISF